MEDVQEPPLKKSRADVDFASCDVALMDTTSKELSSSKDHENEHHKFLNAFSKERGFDRVNYEDVEKLKEFKVLDEVGPDGNDSEGEAFDGDLDDLSEEEIERMLDENLPTEYKGPHKEKEKPYFTREKIVLEEKGTNHFEVLPVDWIIIMHNSGVPVYLHRVSRVCTLSKPYFLGTGSARKHEIPVSAIPCLAYRRALEEEEKQKEINKRIQEQIDKGIITPTNLVNSNSSKCPFKSKFDDMLKGKSNNIVKSHEKIKSNEVKDIGIDIVSADSGEATNNMDENDVSSSTEIINHSEHVELLDEENHAVRKATDINLLKEPLPPDSATNNPIIHKNPDTTKNEVQPNKDPNSDEIPARMKPVVLPDGKVLPAARIETMEDNWKNHHLSHEQVTEYCQSLFKFKKIRLVQFKQWSDRRRYAKAKKAMQRPTLPEGTKIISIPVQRNPDDDKQVQGVLGRAKPPQREWIMNMNGRSYVGVFDEYVRQALQKQPVYEFRQLENATTPYEATVVIDGMRYGVGLGSSKRQAKSAAARESILILIPEMKDQISKEDVSTRIGGTESDLEFFDMVSIEDPRIMGFCTSTMEPSPHAILRICLLRNFGTGDRHIQCETRKLKREQIEFKMTVGKHTATVVCKNKKTGKQRASQAILQALHPHVKSWGSLLRLYGTRSVKSCRMRKMEEQEITLLQDKATVNQPNYAILEKLKKEMLKLRERDDAMKPIGTFIVKDGLPNLSGSRLNNVEI